VPPRSSLASMAGPMRTAARFPSVAPRAGHYESFYLKAGHPSMPLAIWVRYTVHKPAGREPVGSLWFTLFDPREHGPHAVKTTISQPVVAPGSYVRIGDASIAPGRAHGHAEAQGRRASWDLTFDPAAAPLFHLPRPWMYRAPVPRTKVLSPYPGARFRGSVHIDGRALELEGWHGIVGHNWGAEHAERWIWLHGARFDGDRRGDAWLDVALGRVRLGSLTTPWIANGVLSLDGQRQRLGGHRIRLTEVREAPDRCEFCLPGRDITLQGLVVADRKDFAGWIYADPGGSEHHVVNCSVADMTLALSRPGEPPRTLEARGSAVYELGMRETDHGIAIQPFPDP
jgi:hypothetical protein